MLVVGPTTVVVVTVQQHRYVTIQLLAGGTIQVPEAIAVAWLAAVEGWLGTLVHPPPEEQPAKEKYMKTKINKMK